MKRLIVLSVIVILVTLASAQEPVGTWSLKPMVGVNRSNYEGDDCRWAMPKWGLTAGLEIGYQANSFMEVSLGAQYSQQGSMIHDEYAISPNSSNSWSHDDVKLTANYINVPLLANFYLVKGLALKTGLKFGFLLKAEEDVNFRYEDGSVGKGADLMDGFKKFELSIPIGVSYEYRGFVVDARYYYPLSKCNTNEFNIWSGVEGKKGIRTSVLQLTLGYKFAL